MENYLYFEKFLLLERMDYGYRIIWCCFFIVKGEVNRFCK